MKKQCPGCGGEDVEVELRGFLGGVDKNPARCNCGWTGLAFEAIRYKAGDRVTLHGGNVDGFVVGEVALREVEPYGDIRSVAVAWMDGYAVRHVESMALFEVARLEPVGLLAGSGASICQCYEGSIGCLGPPCVTERPAVGAGPGWDEL